MDWNSLHGIRDNVNKIINYPIIPYTNKNKLNIKSDSQKYFWNNFNTSLLPFSKSKKLSKKEKINTHWINDTVSNRYISSYIQQVLDGGIFGYPNRSEILNNKGFSTAERYIKDPEVQAGLNTLINSVLLKRVKFLSSAKAKTLKEKKKAQELVEFIELADSEILGTFKDVFYELTTSGVWLGYSLSEKVYKFVDSGDFKGKLIYNSIKGKRSGLFNFVTDDYDNILAVENLAVEDERYKYIPLEKFVLFTWQKKDSNPYGSALFDICYKFLYSKENILRQLLISTAKYASSSLKIGLNDTSQSEVDKAKQWIDDLQSGGGVVVPQEVIIEFLNESNKGNNPYIPILQWIDSQISLAITGQTLSNNESQGTGTYAQAKVHMNISTLYTSYLQTILEEIFNEQIIRPLIELNFDKDSYPTKLYPLARFEEVVENSKKEFIENVKTATDAGYMNTENIDHVNHVLKILDIPLVSEQTHQDLYKNKQIDKGNNLTNSINNKVVKNVENNT